MPKSSNNLCILIIKRNQRNNLSDLAGQTATTSIKRPGQDKNCQTEMSGGKRVELIMLVNTTRCMSTPRSSHQNIILNITLSLFSLYFIVKNLHNVSKQRDKTKSHKSYHQNINSCFDIYEIYIYIFI